MADEWVRFNEYQDVIASTDLLALLAPTLRKRPANWKWMILAAQNGVQGALVCAINDSSGTSALKVQSAMAKLRWLDSLEGEPPRDHLDDFTSLLKKYRRMYPCQGTIQQLRQLNKLHKQFRNSFAHFVPTGWSIEIAMLPPMIASALDSIEAAMRQHQVAVNIDEELQGRLEQNLAATRVTLASL